MWDVLLGRLKGISLVAIDCSVPLTEQGPFDVLLHKVSDLSPLFHVVRISMSLELVLLPTEEHSLFVYSLVWIDCCSDAYSSGKVHRKHSS